MKIKYKDVVFPSNGEQLAGKYIFSSDEILPKLLFLHGAGKSSKERALPFAEYLASNFGLSSFLFDFSGHGASSGNLGDSSLKRRYEQAVDAIKFSNIAYPISVCGFSMGGHIALELLKSQEIKNIILFYSAVYATEAFDVPFKDSEFSSTIRTYRSWEKSDIFSLIKQFEGNLFIIAGEKDEVVPSDLPKLLIKKAVKAKDKHLLVIPNAPHLLLPVIYESETLLKEICTIIGEYVLQK